MLLVWVVVNVAVARCLHGNLTGTAYTTEWLSADCVVKAPSVELPTLLNAEWLAQSEMVSIRAVQLHNMMVLLLLLLADDGAQRQM